MTLLQDRYGNLLTTGSGAARDAYVAGVDHILGATFGAVGAFEAALAEDPEFALGAAGLARARMMAGDMAGAKAALAEADRLAEQAPERDRAHIAVFALLLAGKAQAARKAVLAHVQEYPRDALIAQISCNVFGLIGFSGSATREAELLAYTTALLPHYGEDWWMLSMQALSLCEVGATAASLEMMEDALALNPHNANGAHFKSHAQYEGGQAEAGLGYLRDWIGGYDRRSVLHGHLSWHMALWTLQAGEIEEMWRIVDDSIAPGASESLPINILTDGAAILWRAELAGHSVAPERWRAMSDYAAHYFPQSGQSFADLHAALAHAMAGDSERLALLSENTRGFAGDLVAPVARAWGAVARGDWRGALDLLTPVMARHQRLGGSRAQRDLLDLTYLNLLLKLGQKDEARRFVTIQRPLFGAAAPVAGYAAHATGRALH